MLKFLLSMALPLFCKFWYIYFHPVRNIFSTSLQTSLTSGLFKFVLLNFQVFWCIPLIMVLLICGLIPLSLKKLCMISNSLNLLKYVLYALSWWMFHVSLKRICILLFFHRVFYEYLALISATWWMVLFSPCIPLQILCLLFLHITVKRVLESPTIIVICLF